jgi:hypothetical protein
MTRILLHEQTLRNTTYQVYKEAEGGFTVESTDRKGATHAQHVEEATVEWLHERLQMRRVNKDEAAEILAGAPLSARVPFGPGWRLNFFAQPVLLVLVALRKAAVAQEGRSFLYTVY